jgi:hypothetical protein
MAARRLSVDEAPGLDRGLFGILLSLDDDALVARPARGFALRISPEHIAVDALEKLVVLEF